jgi:hypothetical membrane protein
MTLWRWASLAGLIALAISILFGMIPGIAACGLPGEPIINFEFVRTPAEVAALFPETCRAVHVAAQRQGLWLDALAFIPFYTAFLTLSLSALRREDREGVGKLVGLGSGMTIVAALCDEFEGIQLFHLLDGLPGTQATIDLLVPAVRLKFALLAIVITIAGYLHFRRPGWRKSAGAIIAVSGVFALVGLFHDRVWLMSANSVAWLVLFAVNVAQAARSARSSNKASS